MLGGLKRIRYGGIQRKQTFRNLSPPMMLKTNEFDHFQTDGSGKAFKFQPPRLVRQIGNGFHLMFLDQLNPECTATLSMQSISSSQIHLSMMKDAESSIRESKREMI